MFLAQTLYHSEGAEQGGGTGVQAWVSMAPHDSLKLMVSCLCVQAAGKFSPIWALLLYSQVYAMEGLFENQLPF